MDARKLPNAAMLAAASATFSQKRSRRRARCDSRNPAGMPPMQASVNSGVPTPCPRRPATDAITATSTARRNVTESSGGGGALICRSRSSTVM